MVLRVTIIIPLDGVYSYGTSPYLRVTPFGVPYRQGENQRVSSCQLCSKRLCRSRAAQERDIIHHGYGELSPWCIQATCCMDELLLYVLSRTLLCHLILMRPQDVIALSPEGVHWTSAHAARHQGPGHGYSRLRCSDSITPSSN